LETSRWLGYQSIFIERQLQSVLNAAARLVSGFDDTTTAHDVLAVLHWLRVPQRVDYKVAIMAFRALNGLSPPYMNQLVRAWSSSSALILITPAASSGISFIATVGGRSFPVAASILWNRLPPDIQSYASLTDFCHKLTTYMFHQFFPDTLL